MAKALDELSPTERRIMLALVSGCTDREIARCVGVTPRYVAGIVYRVRRRWGCITESRVTVANIARRLLTEGRANQVPDAQPRVDADS